MWGWSGRAPRQKCRSPSVSMPYVPPRAPSETCRRPVLGLRAITCFLMRVPGTVTSWRAASAEPSGTEIVLAGPVQMVYAFAGGASPGGVGMLVFAQTPELGLRICGSVFGPAPSFGAARGDQARPARSELRNAYRRDAVPHAMENRSSFSDLGLDPALVRAVDGLGYETPTPIQREAIPPILARRDLIGTAQNGSGKTAAFLLPILQRFLKQSPGKTRALVLSPTRELAAQIEVALRGLAKGTRIRGHAVYGGVGMTPQEHALRSGVDVVVATPGRLLDHMSRRNVDFRGLEVLVLDEADRMLDMGFLPDVRRIVGALPRDRQTLLFSATMPSEIEALSRTIMRNPVRISVSPPHRPPSTIRHEVYPVPQHLKTALLVRLLGREDMMSVLVFVRPKRRADRVAGQVSAAGFPVPRSHRAPRQGHPARAPPAPPCRG